MMWLGSPRWSRAASTGWASLGVVGVLGVGTVSIVDAVDAPRRRRATGRGDARRSSARCCRRSRPKAIRCARRSRSRDVRDSAGHAAVRARAARMRHGAGLALRRRRRRLAREVELESELGPALRGEHRVPPLALWFGDVLGLTRTAGRPSRRDRARRDAAPASRSTARSTLLGDGGDDATVEADAHRCRPKARSGSASTRRATTRAGSTGSARSSRIS